MFDLEGDAESLKSPRDPEDIHVIELGALMIIDSVGLETSDAPLDFAFTWNVYVVSEETAEAVPDISPLELNVKPAGNAPETRAVSYSTA